MAENTKIEWADHTFNPWIGCQVASPEGCKNCYAEALVKRFGGDFATRNHTSEANWKLPLKWNARAAREGRRFRVFCASLADVFDNQVPTAWRMDLFSLIADTPHLDWLVLTKRIGNVMPMCRGDSLMFDMICSRVWLGATIVNQAEAERDIPKLLAVPAHKRFLSIEPMLGPVRLDIMALDPDRVILNSLNGQCGVGFAHTQGDFEGGVDWVICGGESGRQARPMHPDWARSLRDQCHAAGVPFLFKQWGEWVEEDTGMPEPLIAREGDPEFAEQLHRHDGFLSLDGHFVTDPDDMVDGVAYRGLKRPGKKAAGRLLDGMEHNGFPA